MCAHQPLRACGERQGTPHPHPHTTSSPHPPHFNSFTFHRVSRAARSWVASMPLPWPSTVHAHCVLPVARARRHDFWTMKKTSSTMEESRLPGLHSSMAMAFLTFCSR